MKSRPLQVFCGCVNTTESSNTLLDFNYHEISSDIAIATYVYATGGHRLVLKHPKNSFDNCLIIEKFNAYSPLTSNDGKKKIVNVAFILKGINFLLKDDKFTIEEMIESRFNLESISQIVLPELLASHLSLLEIKTIYGKTQQVCIEGWAYQLEHAITEALSQLYDDSHSVNSFKKSDIQKIRLMGYSLKSNLHKKSPTLRQMATCVNMSITKFRIIFKEVLNVSPHQYILNLKLNHAFFLLKKHTLSIPEIACKVGFIHPSTLARLFRNESSVATNKVLSKNY
ncbi:MAG: helix-turn-helix transcriptional regulator [Arcicella sp.]|nr:helix-turn-helix transcriptional regulator [Arcicella sp.]